MNQLDIKATQVPYLEQFGKYKFHVTADGKDYTLYYSFPPSSLDCMVEAGQENSKNARIINDGELYFAARLACAKIILIQKNIVYGVE